MQTHCDSPNMFNSRKCWGFANSCYLPILQLGFWQNAMSVMNSAIHFGSKKKNQGRKLCRKTLQIEL